MLSLIQSTLSDMLTYLMSFFGWQPQWTEDWCIFRENFCGLRVTNTVSFYLVRWKIVLYLVTLNKSLLCKLEWWFAIEGCALNKFSEVWDGGKRVEFL